MAQQKPWEKDWSAPQQGPIVLGTPNPTRAPLDRAELQNRELQAQKSALEIQQLRQKMQQENGGPPIDPKMDALTGAAYLSALPKARASQVQALIEGRMAFPSGAGMRSPYWQGLLTDVAHADPDFDAVNYNSRAATRRDFTAGKSAQNIKALNTAIGHVGQLYDQIPGTASHGGFPFATTVNSIQNAYERGSGDSGISKYEQTAGAVASELTQVFRGTGGAEADVKRYLGELNSNASEEQKKAAVQNIVGLLNSRLQAIGDQYTKGMGTTAQPLQVLDQHAQDVLGKLSGTDGQQPPGIAPGGAIPPSGGPTIPPPPGTPPASGPTAPPSTPVGDAPTRSTKYFMDGAPGGGMALGQDGFQSIEDPQMRGAAKHLEAMLRDRSVPDAAITAYAQKTNANPASVQANLEFRRKYPTYTGSYNAEALGYKQVPIPWTERNRNAVAQSGPGVAATQAANAVSFGNLANVVGATGGNADLARAGMAETAAQHPAYATGGALAGGALAAGGLEAGLGNLAAKAGLGAVLANGAVKASPWVARGADAAYGGISGASSNPDDPLRGALLGTVTGVGGGMFGRQVARTAGGALSGVRDEGVQMLKDAGVPLTFAQAVSQSGRLGGAIKGIEDKMTSLPLVGDMINARRREGVQGFNAAAFKEGLAPIAPLIPPVGQQGVNNIGEQGIGDMQQAVTGAYGKALDGVQVTPDAQFSQQLGNALGLGSAIPRTGPEFAHVVNTKIAPHFNSTTGAVDGPQIQDILQTARKTNFGNDAMGAEANDAMGNVGGAVSDLVGRQQPGVIPALGAANTGYRNLNILADAVGRGSNTEGLFTPAQLDMAAKANTKRFGGKIAAASDSRPFFDLQRAGQDILPSKVPDSGSGGRLAMMAAIGGAGMTGGGAGYAVGDAQTGGEVGIGTLMALAAGGSKTAQKLLTAMVLNRPNSMIAAGKAVGKSAPIGGMFGAGGAPLFLPSQ